MASLTTIITPCLITLTAIVFLAALVYIIPVLIVRRFHNLNNAFTVNLCLAIMCCDMYWFSYFIIVYFFPEIYSTHTWHLTQCYFSMMCNIQVPLAILAVSVHRLCSIVYRTERLFKKKRWATICFSCQWTTGIICALPELFICTSQIWSRIYPLLMVVIIPSVICFIINIIIFQYARLSRHRVQPTCAALNNNNRHQTLTRRDIYLLRHMILMFIVFVGGWSPIYIYPLVVVPNYRSIIPWIIFIVAKISLVYDIVNLFLYNHPLRKYVLQKIFQ